MLLRFLRTRNQKEFRARSPERDKESDQRRIGEIARVISDSIQKFEAEREGLTRRSDCIRETAAFLAGNGSDEYLTRDEFDNATLVGLEQELARADRRILTLIKKIGELNSLNETFAAKFIPASIAS